MSRSTRPRRSPSTSLSRPSAPRLSADASVAHFGEACRGSLACARERWERRAWSWRESLPRTGCKLRRSRREPVRSRPLSRLRFQNCPAALKTGAEVSGNDAWGGTRKVDRGSAFRRQRFTRGLFGCLRWVGSGGLGVKPGETLFCQQCIGHTTQESAFSSPGDSGSSDTGLSACLSISVPRSRSSTRVPTTASTNQRGMRRIWPRA